MHDAIDIIIPVFNAKAYVERCVNSVLSQTMQVSQIILIDDGSTDGSTEICKRLAQSDSRIQFYQCSHQGVSATRNKGLDTVDGNWLSFVDADDYISPVMIETLYECCQKYDVPMAQCRYRKTQNDYEATPDFNIPSCVQLYTGKRLHYLLNGDASGHVRCLLITSIFKRELFGTIRFPIGKIHEDEATIHHILNNSKRMASVNAKLYFYYNNSESIMRRKYSREKYDIFPALDDRIELYHSLGWDDLVFLTQLRYQLALLENYKLTCEYIKDSYADQVLLLDKYRHNLESMVESRFMDTSTRLDLETWGSDPSRGPTNLWGYIREWIVKSHTVSVE
jgi:glycosyltransferase involved in cell wall biosynthesis